MQGNGNERSWLAEAHWMTWYKHVCCQLADADSLQAGARGNPSRAYHLSLKPVLTSAVEVKS